MKMELKLLAIDDIKFTSVRGEEISRNNLVKEMVDYYALKVQEGETRVTDFNEGSEIRNLLESIAVDVYYLMQNENDILRNCFIDTANRAAVLGGDAAVIEGPLVRGVAPGMIALDDCHGDCHILNGFVVRICRFIARGKRFYPKTPYASVAVIP